MQTYETLATVEDEGQVRVAGVPFAAGTEVEVTISPKRRPAEAFVAAWEHLCRQMRVYAQEPGEDEIQAEIDAYRARR